MNASSTRPASLRRVTGPLHATGRGLLGRLCIHTRDLFPAKSSVLAPVQVGGERIDLHVRVSVGAEVPVAALLVRQRRRLRRVVQEKTISLPRLRRCARRWPRSAGCPRWMNSRPGPQADGVRPAQAGE
ncbi:hypothetical protein FQZ97_713900 [compost metagenome]